MYNYTIVLQCSYEFKIYSSLLTHARKLDQGFHITFDKSRLHFQGKLGYRDQPLYIYPGSIKNISNIVTEIGGKSWNLKLNQSEVDAEIQGNI